MPQIDWFAFTWEAFATLVTGGFAVVAAYLIGRKQMAILARQADIQAKQVELQSLQLRANLFDRRIKVYDATFEWLRVIAAQGYMPGDHELTTPETREIEFAFYRAIYASQLLFGRGIYDKLETLRQRAIEWTLLKQTDVVKAGEIYMELVQLTERLDDFFGDELKLGETPPKPTALEKA